LYDQFRQEADEAALYDKEINIIASDIDPKMVEIAKDNATEVGLGDIIQFKVQDVHNLEIPEGPVSIIGNPPYGERIGERSEVEAMYKHLGEIMKQNEQASLYMLTSYKEFEPLVGKKATKRRKLFNGYIECTYYQYWGKRNK